MESKKKEICPGEILKAYRQDGRKIRPVFESWGQMYVSPEGETRYEACALSALALDTGMDERAWERGREISVMTHLEGRGYSYHYLQGYYRGFDGWDGPTLSDISDEQQNELRRGSDDGLRARQAVHAMLREKEDE